MVGIPEVIARRITRSLWTSTALWLGLVAAVACAPRQQSVNPGINANYADAKVEDWTARFEVESREIFRERDRIVAELGLKPGMRVADVGAGTGLFVEPFARAVGPEGRVYAVDIVPNFVTHIEERAEALGLRNTTPVLCTDRSVELPRGSVDFVFICDTYHHFEYPRDTLASIRRALKPGGEMVVIDFIRIPGVSPAWVINHCRAGKETFIHEIEEAGFDLVDDGAAVDFLTDNYMLRFRR